MTTPAPLSFDARPLTDPVDPKAVKAFIRETRSRGGGISAGTVILIIVVAIMLVVAVPLVGMGIATAVRTGTFMVGLPFLLIIVVIAIIAIIGLFAYRRARVARYRLSRFAAANGMTYTDKIADPPLPGMIFSIGRARQARHLVRGSTPRFVEFGNYQYTTGSGKNSTTYKWGYVAVKLDVPLPNIVLDALGNNAIFGSNLPASFQKEQQLSLEGDFDKYFTLYCPEGYEQDALYLFTPDIMARFIDNAAQLDVEIVDDWLFLYTKRQASTLDAATWAWLFGTVGALITKFDQWARWRDDRLAAASTGQVAARTVEQGAGSHALPFAPPAELLRPPPGVAREGRRLKRGGRWLPIMAIVLFAIGWIWVQSLSYRP